MTKETKQRHADHATWLDLVKRYDDHFLMRATEQCAPDRDREVALRLAIESSANASTGDLVARAGAFLDFLSPGRRNNNLGPNVQHDQ